VTSIPGRCRIDASGRLRGPASITWNTPWPTVNGTPGGFGTAFGGVFHTEVGYDHNVVVEFNSPSAQASAFFSIDMAGNVHQYGPLGKDWMAWTQVAGNPHWRGVEHEDKGNPANPLSDAQLAASAQVFEAMSAFDGWPLQVTDDVNGRGIILHSDGGVPWGNHACPGAVRAAQRPDLIALALKIRRAAVPGRHEADGAQSLLEAAELAVLTVAEVIEETLRHEPDGFGPLQRRYLNAGNLVTAPMPERMVYWFPA
jgi:hypothetical protein